MVLVLLQENEVPSIYLIPSHVWLNENALFRDRNYEGKQSEPEWGINISKKNMDLLKAYEFKKQIENSI